MNNKIRLLKGIGLLLSVGGMVITSIAGGKENKLMLEKLVDAKLGK